MKYLFLILFITISSCTPPQRFEKLIPPIILVGESKEGDIIVVDKNNTYLTLGKNYFVSQVISDTYEKGDTLLMQNIYKK